MRIIKTIRDTYRKANILEEADEYFTYHKEEIGVFCTFFIAVSLFAIGCFIFNCIKYGL